jgi:hypothetical protein
MRDKQSRERERERGKNDLKRYGEENKGKRDDYPKEKAVYHYG